MRPWKGERYVVWYNFALMVFLRPHLVGVNSVNWESGSQLTFPRVGYLSPISTDAVLSTFSIAYFITSHYNSYQPILPLFINRYNVKQSDTLTIARIQTHQILNSFWVFWAADISFTSLHPFLSGGGSESFCHKYNRPSQPTCTLSRQPTWHSNWGNYPQTSYPLMHPRRYRLAFNGGYLSQLLGKHSIDILPQTTFKFFAFLSQTKQ